MGQSFNLIPLLQGGGLLLLSPMIVGLLRFLRSLFSSRHRHIATILHPYWDLWETAKRASIQASSTSHVFAMAPLIQLMAYGGLAFSVPILFESVLLPINLLFVPFILGLARFSLSLAGTDTLTSFGWIGSSREMFYQFITEVGMAVFMVGLVIKWGGWDKLNMLDLIGNHVDLGGGIVYVPTLLLLAISFFVVLLFEFGRNPVGSPTTHLELTMGQRAIGLEYAGRNLAMLEYAEMVKVSFLVTFYIDIFMPSKWSLLGQGAMPAEVLSAFLIYVSRVTFFLFVLSFWEATRPRRRLREVLQLGLIGMFIGGVAILYELLTMH